MSSLLCFTLTHIIKKELVRIQTNSFLLLSVISINFVPDSYLSLISSEKGESEKMNSSNVLFIEISFIHLLFLF